MITRNLFIVIALIAVTACTPRVVPTERGVGFDDFSRFELERAQREAQLADPIVPPQANAALLPIPQTAPASGISSSDLAQAGIGGGSDPLRTGGVQASPTNPEPTLIFPGSAGLSDEQSFDAVTGRETIQSDAQRRAAQAAARTQIVPAPLPERPAGTGPNIVAYALTAPNAKGQELYSRSLFSTERRAQTNCMGYSTADDAQRAFLDNGGPERDRLGIDPDGDGFACGWDPAPFIQAARN